MARSIGDDAFHLGMEIAQQILECKKSNDREPGVSKLNPAPDE